MKIIVVEDDRQTSDYLAQGLREAGHGVDIAETGLDGLMQVSHQPYDLMIADCMLPGLDGLAMVRALRSAGQRLPILFLSTLGGIHDRVEGLNAGGDDYLVKPFAFDELTARINALLRRPPLEDAPKTLRSQGLEIDLGKRKVFREGKPVDLKPTEFRILEYLMRHAGQVVTRTMLLEHVWDFHFDPNTNIVETHVSRLRRSLRTDGRPDPIETIRGAGYIIHDGG